MSKKSSAGLLVAGLAGLGAYLWFSRDAKASGPAYPPTTTAASLCPI